MMWSVNVYRFDNAKKAVGCIVNRFATKREALTFLSLMGIRTDQKKLLGEQPASLVSRVGHSYIVQANR